MRAKLATAVALLLLWAGSARAVNQPPHDFAHGVTCSSCHIPYGGLSDPEHWFTASGTQDATSATVAGAGWAPNQWIGGVVTFMTGANQYKTRAIVGNTATSVSWSEPLPATSPAEAVDLQINKIGYDDVELKCKSCHNPTGPVPGDVGLHYTGSAGAIGCGKCHEPHNIDANSGWSGAGGGNLIRAAIRVPGGGTKPVVYAPGGPLVQPAGNGVCQVCHTQTAYWRNDGSLQTHKVGESCATCHGHTIGFGGGATTSAHFDATAAAWSDHGWSQGCLRCHTKGGFRDYIGEADGKDNHLSGSFNTEMTTSAWGPLECNTCHNAVSDPATGTLATILFPSLKQVSTDHSTALCGQCHQARESTASMATKITSGVATANKGVGFVSSSANAAGTINSIVRTGSTWGIDAFKGNRLLFTTGTHKDTWVTVSTNTATSISFTPDLGSATASGEGFTVWPAASTGGTTTSLADSNRAWTAGQWVDFYVYFQTGANAGLYRRITANTATALTVGNLPAAPAAGDLYEIISKENTTVLDAQLASSNSFTNSHYLGAAAIMFGADSAGLYMYPGETYTGTNVHGVSASSCASCHNPHTLEIAVNETTCGRCHFNEDGSPVSSMAELEEARQFGFIGDVDGDGVEESLKVEIDGLAAKLYEAMQAYSLNVAGARFCYNQAAYPYVYNDANNDGICGAPDVAFAKFTPRLLRASFNYNFIIGAHEPGAWAHNPRFVIEELFDGIADLNAGLVAKGFSPVPFSGFRTFEGHFGAVSEAMPSGGDQFADWDGSVVPNNCSQCHAGERGIENYLANPWTTTTNRPVTGMQCTTCHDPLASDGDMSRLRAIAGVRFPPRSSNGAGGQQAPIVKTAADFADPADAVCATCHSGREGKGSIDFRTAGAGAASGGTATSLTVPAAPASGWGNNAWVGATVTFTSGANGGSSVVAAASNATSITWATALPAPVAAGDTFTVAFGAGAYALGFTNPHYLGAAAVVLGTESKMLYEYAGKTYAGKAQHHGATASCVDCHDPKATRHSFEVADATAVCATCHGGPGFAAYKRPARAGVGYDGHTPAEELGVQTAHLADALYAAIRAAAAAPGAGGAICYNGAANPYWFFDNGAGGGVAGDGVCQSGETTSYNKLNPAMLRAAFNYQWSRKEPGAWAHNFDYVAQVLVDSIESLGGDVTGYIRP